MEILCAFFLFLENVIAKSVSIVVIKYTRNAIEKYAIGLSFLIILENIFNNYFKFITSYYFYCLFLTQNKYFSFILYMYLVSFKN